MPQHKAKTPSWVEPFVYVIGLKRFVSKKTGLFYDKEQFVDVYGWVKLPGAPRTNAASYFLHGGGGEKVQGITFCPGEGQFVLENGHRMFNAYRPPAVKATYGSVKPWLNLGEHVIPDP